MTKPKIFYRKTNEFDLMQPLTEGFIIVDTEDDTKGKTYLFGVYSKDGFTYFRDVKDLLVYVNLRPEKYVFCFNLSYDIFNILGYGMFEYDYFFIQSRVAKIKCFGKTWLDAYNHWNISVENAGEILGKKKIKIVDYTKKVSIEYLKRDCQIEYEFTEYMLKTYLNAGIEYKLTIASTALYNFLQYSNVNPEIDVFYPNMFYSYYGGRVNVFKKGKFNNVYGYDINSAYPFVMANQKYPYPLKVINKPNLKYDGITECLVSCNFEIPILPYRNDKKEIFFPNGVFKGTWCNNELNYFLSKGGKILKTYNGIHFVNSEYIFKTWVLDLYDKRLKAKTYYETTVYKTILNALYGKFGQRSINTRVIDTTDKNLKDFDGEIIHDKLIINTESTIPKHSNIIWSAMITANVRIYLHKYLDLLGINNIIYCDTDSIITKKKLPNEIIDAKKLGYFKLEKTGTCEIFAPKVYKFNDEIKIKGIPKRAIGKNIKDKYEFDRPIKILEGLKRNLRPNVWHKEVKELSLNIKNCKVGISGICKPLILKEGN